MKTIIATAAAALFATNVSAVEIYHGLDEGNSDLSVPTFTAEDVVGVQPGIGDSVYRYHGLSDGNHDLFRGDGSLERESTGRPDIYMGLGGSPDLLY